MFSYEDDSSVIQAWNDYTVENHYDGDYIHTDLEELFNMLGLSAYDAVQAVYRGSCHIKDTYFIWNDYGWLAGKL